MTNKHYPPVPTGLSLVTLLALLLLFFYLVLVLSCSAAQLLSLLRLACLSTVKVVFWHVFERYSLQVSVSRYKLVT